VQSFPAPVQIGSASEPTSLKRARNAFNALEGDTGADEKCVVGERWSLGAARLLRFKRN
jgi:hypothetical protein